MATPTLAELIALAVRQGALDLHVSLPARVQSYNAGKKLATIQPLIRRQSAQGEIKDRPIVNNVPVAFLEGGGAIISMPLKKGDEGMLMFCDRSLDRYLSTGGFVDPDPGDDRNHDISDAWFVPGVRPFNHTSEASGEDLLVKFGDAQLRMKPDGAVVLNAAEKSVNQGVVRKSDPYVSSQKSDTPFWTFFAAFFAIVTGPSIPEPGNGSPSALQIALAAAITAAGGTPTSVTSAADSASKSVFSGD